VNQVDNDRYLNAAVLSRGLDPVDLVVIAIHERD